MIKAMKMNSFGFLLIANILLGTTYGFAQKAAKPKQKTANGVEYVVFRHNDTDRKINQDDFVILNLSYAVQRNGLDSLIFESATATEDGKMVLQITESAYPGDILEGISILSENDSARFAIRADSFFMKTVRVEQVPPFVNPSENIYFNIGVDQVLSLEEMQQKQMEIQAKQEEEMKSVTEKQLTDIKDYLKSQGYDASPDETGMFIVKTKEGTGEMPANGKSVNVHYTGKLLNGTVFDSSVERGQPFSFKLGSGQVIKGWDLGIAQLKPGEKAILGIPSSLAYGARAVGPIPANSPLIFEVELISYE
ncbi:MAG: FKBP-type peptidyl-prolyl cis-trans isomerase [Bacteroidia bacterium]